MKKPVIGLALGSGAAKGLAHIGVLQALDENGVKIDCLAGCSAGALFGSLYCCDIKPYIIHNLALQIDRKLWLDLTVPKRGFIKGEKIEELLKLLTRERNIEELDKKLFVIATDLISCSMNVFTQGPIYKAVRASISIPGIFVPVRYNNMLLVDGAVTDRVPASILKENGVDIVIGVDVGYNTENVRISHVFDVILQSIDVMSKQIMKNKLINADILIKPNLRHIKPSRFDKVDECVKIGYDETISRMDDIKQTIKEFNIKKD